MDFFRSTKGIWRKTLSFAEGGRFDGKRKDFPRRGGLATQGFKAIGLEDEDFR